MPGVKQVTDTQTDWQQGTLSGVVATAAGDLELGTTSRDDFVWDTRGKMTAVTIDSPSGGIIAASESITNGVLTISATGHSSVSSDLYDVFHHARVLYVERTGDFVVSTHVSGFSGATYQWSKMGIIVFDAVPPNATKMYALMCVTPSNGFAFQYDNNGDGKLETSVDQRGTQLTSGYVRLRRVGNTIYGDYSTDGINWTNQGSFTFANAPASVYVGLFMSPNNHSVGGGTVTAAFEYVDGLYELYLQSGTRTSPPIDLSPVGDAVAGSIIAWNATTPAGTSVTVETNLSLDGGQTWQGWRQATNGGAIPGITPGMDLSNARLQTRQTLATTDTTVTPQLHSLTLRVPMAGSVIVPARYEVGVSTLLEAPTSYEVGAIRSLNLPVRYEVGTKRSIEIPLEAKMVGISPRFAARRMIAAQLFLSRPDGQTWEDVTEALSYVSWNLGDVSSLGTGNEGVDQRVRTANFRLHQHRIPGGPNLSPLDRESPWNRFNGDYDPLVWPLKMVVYRVSIGDPGDDMPHRHLTVRWAERIGTGDGVNRTFYLYPAPITVNTERIYVNGELMERTVDYTVDYDTGEVTFAKAPAAGLPITADYSYWRTAFVGYVDDWKADGSTVELICRDKASWLQDTYIEVTRAYGSAEGTPLEQVIQKILDDNMGFGEIPLYVQRPTGFLATPYLVEYQSVWDAIQTAVVKTIGWYLGYRYDEKTNDFHLMLLEPPRNKGPEDADWAFDWRDDIYVNEVGGSIADVRNVCRVTFRNSATGLRETVTYQDDESIRKHRRRAMQIEEADASMIDTPAEAMRLAKAAVDDLKDQHATVRMEIPFSPFVDVMDGILITDERISSTQDFFAVESVEHVMDFDAARFRTSIVASGRVAGAHGLWLEMETRPGAQQPTKMIAADRVEVTQSKPPKPEGVQAFGIPMGIVVTVPEPGYVMKNWKFTRVRVYNASGDLVAQYEARSSRFEFSGLAIGGTYTAEAQYEDTEGATGEWSDRVSAVASGDVAFLSMSVSENLTVGGTANVSGAVTGQVVRATQYIQLPVLSEDPSNPPNGAMWMRS